MQPPRTVRFWLQAADTASGAVQPDGRRVDKPVTLRARRIVARAGHQN